MDVRKKGKEERLMKEKNPMNNTILLIKTVVIES